MRVLFPIMWQSILWIRQWRVPGSSFNLFRLQPQLQIHSLCWWQSKTSWFRKSQGIKVQSHFKDRFFYHNQSLKLAELLRKLFFLSNFWLITRFVTCLNLDESYEQVSKHLSTYSRAMLWLICTVEPADCINLQRITIINGQQKHWTLYIYIWLTKNHHDSVICGYYTKDFKEKSIDDMISGHSPAGSRQRNRPRTPNVGQPDLERPGDLNTKNCSICSIRIMYDNLIIYNIPIDIGIRLVYII